MRRFAPVLAASLSALAIAAPVQAQEQRFTGVTAFGDSYADNGNFFRIAGLVPFPAPYPNGRFSNGTNFVDTIGDGLALPQTNFAIGGAQTGTGNQNAGAPGFQQQWQGFVAQNRSFSPTEIVAISVGGNDARAYRLGGGTVAGAPAAAQASIANATAGINALVARGIRTLVWTAGDVGGLPEAAGQASAAAGSAYSQAYNTGVRATLATVAANGVQVAYVDISAIGRQIQSNPAAYGITNATGVCPLPACLQSPQLADSYVFYFDGVHLTSRGFAIVGQYALNQIQAPYALASIGELPLVAGRGFARRLDGRLDLARGRENSDGVSVFLSADLGDERRGRSVDQDGYDVDSRGLSGGAELSAGPALLGAALSYGKTDLDSRAGTLGGSQKSWQGGVYAVVEAGGFFAQGQASYGDHKLRTDRAGVVSRLTTRTKGRSYGAAARVGWLAGLGPVSAGPVAGIDWAKGRVRGFREQGDLSLQMQVDRQRLRSLVGSLGAEARLGLAERVSPYVRVTAEKELDGDDRSLRYFLFSAPSIVNTLTVPGRSEKTYGVVQGGVSASLWQGVSLDVDFRKSFGRSGDDDDMAAFAGVRFGF